jgi:MFS family permease
MPFRNRNYRLLWIANLIASFSGHVAMIAFPLAAIRHLGAGEWEMGLLVAVETLPFVLFSLPSGALVDRFATHKVVLWCFVALALATVIVPLSFALGAAHMGWLYLAGFLMGTVMCLEGVAAQVFTTELVSRKALVEANAWMMGTESGLKLIAPAAGGMLVEWLGAPMTLWCEVLLVGMAALVLTRIRHEATRERPAPRPLAETLLPLIAEGVRAVWQSPILRSAALVVMLWQLLWHGVYAMLVLYATRDVGLSAAQLGLASACGAAGVLAATMGSKRIELRLGLGKGMLIGLAGAGLGWGLMAGVVALPAGMRFWAFALSYAVMDFGLTIGFVCYLSLRQVVAADHLLGRVVATMRFSNLLLAPFGSALFGALAKAAGMPWAFGLAAGLCLLLTLAASFTVLVKVRSAAAEEERRRLATAETPELQATPDAAPGWAAR